MDADVDNSTRWLAVVALVVVLMAGCGSAGSGRTVWNSSSSSPASPSPPPPSSAGPSATPAPSATRTAPGVPTPGPAIQEYVRRLPGVLGMVVRDRTGGSVWTVGQPEHRTWTASTIKLALATALLERHRAGTIALTAADRTQLRSMLVDSSNAATDALWTRYDGVSMLPEFRSRYGMGGLGVVNGYRPYWRHLECGATDLAALMTYALGRLHPDDRGYLVGALRAAAGVQRWGVWAAGAALSPGHKPGWAFKPEGRPDHWVVHSVGFAGPGERYVVAVMYDMPRGANVHAGAQAVSDVVALAFGRPVPAAIRGP